MKVLFVNTTDTSGGAARAAWRIMRGVQHSGVEAQMFVKYKQSQADDVISLLQFAPTNPIYKACDWVARKIKNQWQHYKWHPYKRTQQDAYMSDLRSTRIHGALQHIDYDIMHLHWINMRFLDVRELAKVPKPIVWTLHDTWPFCGICHYFEDCEKYQKHCGACPMLGSEKEKDLANEVFEKKRDAYKDLDLHIVTPSRWLGDCVKKSTLLGRFPVHVIPNCIDTNIFRPTQHLKEQAKPIILYGAMHAALDKRKGFASLLAAIHLLDKQGFEAQLVVFGAEAQELPMRFEHIDINFVGYINDNRKLAELYSEANVMVVPSLTENLSNAIMESLSCGTPVVGFDIGGNGDMIVHKKNGYLAKEKDCGDLAKGIEWCLSHNTDGALSNNAREKVIQNFTIDIVAKQYRQLYQTLL